MKGTLLNHLHFTRSERRGLFILLLFILGIAAYPWLSKMVGGDGDPDYVHSEFSQQINEWEEGLVERDSMGWKKRASYHKRPKRDYSRKWDKNENRKKDGKPAAVALNPFPFNPNEADKNTLLDLGLPERVVNTLLNFRNKGGRFYKKEDLKKVYGLKAEWYEQLAPHVDIPKKQKTPKGGTPPLADIPKEYDNSPRPKKTYEPVVVDINKATAEEFQKIRGIGPYYSKKIVRFRELLGGYHSVAQVGEVRGLPDSTFQTIKTSLELGDAGIRKININTVSAEELKGHPYVKWKTANAIVKYRETHGAFANIADLKKVYAVPSELYNKLSPYLTVTD